MEIKLNKNLIKIKKIYSIASNESVASCNELFYAKPMLKKRRLRKGHWGERGLMIRVDVTDEPVVEYEQLVHQEQNCAARRCGLAPG